MSSLLYRINDFLSPVVVIKELLFDRHSRELTAIEPLSHGELPSSCPSRRFFPYATGSLRQQFADSFSSLHSA